VPKTIRAMYNRRFLPLSHGWSRRVTVCANVAGGLMLVAVFVVDFVAVFVLNMEWSHDWWSQVLGALLLLTGFALITLAAESVLVHQGWSPRLPAGIAVTEPTEVRAEIERGGETEH
jgi:protein-S-isoprenylcysteine O-methyltransferase Ste14